MGVREDRLQAEFESIKRFRSNVMTWRTIGNSNPPDKYELTFHLKSVVAFDVNQTPVFHTGFCVIVEFPSDYPRAKPIVFLSADCKPWPIHPNIWPDGRLCLEDVADWSWIPGIGVAFDNLCQMIGEIIAFQQVNTKSPANANRVLLDWVERTLTLEEGTATRVKNPVDTSVIRLPDPLIHLRDTETTAAQQNQLTLTDLCIVVEHTGKRIPVSAISADVTASELMDALAGKINLPVGTRGVLTRKRNYKQLLPNQTLLAAGVEDNETLIADFERTAGGSDASTIRQLEQHRRQVDGGKQLRLSVSFPQLLSKRFESSFLVQIYLPEERAQVKRNIKLEFGEGSANEHWQATSIGLQQRIRVRLFGPAFDFPESVTKLIDASVNRIVLVGMPKEGCEPGVHKILVSVSDAADDEEIMSSVLLVRVVDFAFDHVSRPMLSKVSAVILGIGSFLMFILTSMEQIDKTVGLASGTAAGVLAMAIYLSFHNLYQRVYRSTQ